MPIADAAEPHGSHAIVSSSVGPEYYVSIMSFVDKSQARALAHNATLGTTARVCALLLTRLPRARNNLAPCSWSPAARC